jgi:hypothetical protein
MSVRLQHGMGDPRDRSISRDQSGSQRELAWAKELIHLSSATRRPLADVINQAAKGTFNFANLKTLGCADTDKVLAALAELQRMEAAA